MAVYVYRNGQMVDKATGEPMNPPDAEWVPAVPMSVDPITPYESPMDGTLITDRRQEREHMRKHNVIHAADDKSRPSTFRNRRFVEKHGLWDRAEV